MTKNICLETKKLNIQEQSLLKINSKKPTPRNLIYIPGHLQITETLKVQFILNKHEIRIFVI